MGTGPQPAPQSTTAAGVRRPVALPPVDTPAEVLVLRRGVDAIDVVVEEVRRLDRASDCRPRSSGRRRRGRRRRPTRDWRGTPARKLLVVSFCHGQRICACTRNTTRIDPLTTPSAAAGRPRRRVAASSAPAPSRAETSARLTPAEVPRIELTRSCMPKKPRSSWTSRTPGLASRISVAAARRRQFAHGQAAPHDHDRHRDEKQRHGVLDVTLDMPGEPGRRRGRSSAPMRSARGTPAPLPRSPRAAGRADRRARLSSRAEPAATMTTGSTAAIASRAVSWSLNALPELARVAAAVKALVDAEDACRVRPRRRSRPGR